MKFHQIFINDEPSIDQNACLVTIIKEVDKRDDTYYFQEYSRIHGKHIQIGIEIENASRVSIQGYPYIIFTESLNITGLWCMQPNTEIEFGFNACGKFLIEAFDINDELISQETLLVLPRTLTFKQYLLMQAEVRDLLIAFNTVPTSEIEGGNRWIRKSTFPLEKFRLLFKKFKNGLEDVLEAPAEILISRQQLMRRESVKRWTPRMLIESQAYAGQPKIKASVLDRSHHILEHGMIRNMLDTLNEMIQQALDIESINAGVFEKEIESRDQVPINAQSITEGSILSALQNKQEEVQKHFTDTLEKIDSLNELKLTLLSFREEEQVFNVPSEQVEETHLFIHDPRYNEVFESYEEIIHLIPKMDFEKKHFIEQILKSPYLFEIWTLLQLYAECMRLQFLPPISITDELFKHYKKYKKLSHLTIKFTHTKTKDRIDITYEPEIKIPEISSRKPDYYISFINRLNNSYNSHTLDAKYKPYSDPQFEEYLLEDMIHSGQRYVEDFSGTRFRLSSAALVHNDVIENTYNWNVRLQEEIERIPYTYSHFSIAPGNMNHLNTYMKRIIHQYNGNYGYCPSCGTMNSGDPHPKKSPYKWTYICECQEVWVNNVCKNDYRQNYHRPGFTGPDTRLLKYAYGNYNKQVEDKWDVHCQECNLSFQGTAYTTTILGQQIEM